MLWLLNTTWTGVIDACWYLSLISKRSISTLIPRGERLPFGILTLQERGSALRSVRLSVAYASSTVTENLSNLSFSGGKGRCAFDLISPPLRNLITTGIRSKPALRDGRQDQSDQCRGWFLTLAVLEHLHNVWHEISKCSCAQTRKNDVTTRKSAQFSVFFGQIFRKITCYRRFFEK